MRRQRANCFALAVLASWGLGMFVIADGNKKDTLKPLPPKSVKEWTDAGAEPGWMVDMPPQPSRGYGYWEPFRDEVESGATPAFRFHPDKADTLAKLPDPGMAFGLDFHCSLVTGAWLKNLAALKSLQSLNIGGALGLKDEDLKELAALKNLQALYLFYTPVTDAGLPALAELKNLQVLDLSNTRVTDAGLKDVAKLKDLQCLNLHKTKVTASGVAGLQKELPKCKIVVNLD